MPDNQKKESDIVREICEYLERQSLFFWRQNNTPVYGKSADGVRRFRAMPRYSRKGVPDIIILYEGAFIGLEVKRPKAYQTQEQKDFEIDVHKNKGHYYVVHNVEEARDVMYNVMYNLIDI